MALKATGLFYQTVPEYYATQRDEYEQHWEELGKIEGYSASKWSVL